MAGQSRRSFRSRRAGRRGGGCAPLEADPAVGRLLRGHAGGARGPAPGCGPGHAAGGGRAGARAGLRGAAAGLRQSPRPGTLRVRGLPAPGPGGGLAGRAPGGRRAGAHAAGRRRGPPAARARGRSRAGAVRPSRSAAFGSPRRGRGLSVRAPAAGARARGRGRSGAGARGPGVRRPPAVRNAGRGRRRGPPGPASGPAFRSRCRRAGGRGPAGPAGTSGREGPAGRRLFSAGLGVRVLGAGPETLNTRRYVILGNGIAGQTCAEELRALDADCAITMVAAERHPLYNRVALPRYLRGQVRREKVFMRTAEDYAAKGIEIHFETWATEVDAQAKVVRTNRGQELPYDALLVATGGRPKPPPWAGVEDVDHVLGFQTIDDTDAIIERADTSERTLVMGGSFIGYEIAEGVVHRGRGVTWIMRGPWFLRYVLDEEGGTLCRQLGEAAGCQFIVNDEVKRFSRHNGRFQAETQGGEKVLFDTLTYGVGLDYYVEPVARAGVELRKGIVCDAKLRTALPDVYTAGDIAVFFDLMVGKHNQMGTWDNAEAHGKVAAHNMAGADEDFFDVPTYTTTMFGSTLAVMGVTPDVQPDLDSVRTYSFEEKFFRKLFFLEDRLVGAIMIGPPKGRKKLIEIMRSRQKIERPKEELLDPANLKD
ncbi:MAG: hypothetical protein E6I08_09740 [Chloroflexi bacterium]|nr:MAG: hypothetical protein E6I08_09740 [Chloroflexota bacterium]